MTAPAADRARDSWQLVQRAQAGDSDAFAEIYQRYQPTVYRYVYFRVGNRQLAEDFTQDAFLRALKNIGRFTWQGRDYGAWLVTLARNVIADHFKSHHVRRTVSVGEVMDFDHVADDDVAREIERNADVAEVRATLPLLTVDQQAAVKARWLDEMSVAEAAEHLGINEGAVKAATYRATRSMRRIIEQRRSSE
jgi:RNA polymerase sigma-70 factor (ECF subfamily)